MNKNTDPNKLVASIIKTYEKNIKHLSNYQKGHFFTRAYKVTGNRKYIGILVEFAFAFCFHDFAEAGENIKRGKYKYKQDIAFRKIKSQRARNRISLYKKHPKLKAYMDFLHYFIYINKFQLRKKVFMQRQGEVMESLKKENFSKIFLSTDKMKADGSYIFNCVYILKELKICDLTKEAVALLKEIYFKKNGELKSKITKNNFISLIYALTHIIIAESEYYEKEAKNNLWILNIFIDNMEKIKELPIDTLAEVGICFKLCRKEKQYKKEFNSVKEDVLRRYPHQNLKTKEAIIQKEHTNSMVMLLFSSKNNFYKGPSLEKVFKKGDPWMMQKLEK